MSTTVEMQYRTLGKTGEKVSAIGLGGWHIGFPTTPEKESIALMHEAMERGINFLDNSWDYNEGISELRMGKALQGGKRRAQAFVMTKIDGRTKKEAARQLEQSLQRLQVDCIDLVQHHEVIRFEDPNRIFAEDGAQEALVEAKKAGKLRYIGFTGHKDPHVHLYMLDVAAENGFHFDAVQMPLNVMDAHYRSFEKLVLPRLVAEDIGVLGMKSMANGSVVRSNTVTPVEAIHYALHLPVSVVIAGMENRERLDQACEALRTFKPLTQEQAAALLEKTKQAAKTGEFEPFKTSSLYDATALNPKWLGEEPERLKALVQA